MPLIQLKKKRIFRPLDSLSSLNRESKLYVTFRSIGVSKIRLHLGLGVGLRGKLELTNISLAKYRKKNNENIGLFYCSDCDTGFSLNNRPKRAKKTTPGISFPTYSASFYHRSILKKTFFLQMKHVVLNNFTTTKLAQCE